MSTFWVLFGCGAEMSAPATYFGIIKNQVPDSMVPSGADFAINPSYMPSIHPVYHQYEAVVHCGAWDDY